MSVTQQDIQAVYDEKDAVQHYLSEDRRDSVKVEWEEPFSCSVFQKAIALLDKPAGSSLDIIDVGAGTGDGYALLSNLFASQPELNQKYKLNYTGVDISPQMVETANELHAQDPRANFQCADIRTAHIDRPYDLYLSCGVPYSHLTTDELLQSVRRICSNIRETQSRCVVIINTLGRYSIEWSPQWSKHRWDYRMSFFHTEEDAEPTLMTFYSHLHLQDIMQQGASAAGCGIPECHFFDRSVMVGRHTSTGEFNRTLPKYRNLINQLFSPVPTDLKQLRFRAELGEGPDYIMKFFKGFAPAWDTLVASAAAVLGEPFPVTAVELPAELQGFPADLNAKLAKIPDAATRRQTVERCLANALGQLEATLQQGYGVGHDLFGMMLIDPRK